MTPLNHKSFDDPTWPIVVDGESMRREGNVQSALRVFNSAVAKFTEFTLDSVQVETYICRGVANAQIGNENEAIADFTTAIQIDANRALAYFNRSCARERLGQYDLAIDDLDRVIKLQPDYAEVYVNRGRLRKRLGQLDDARQDFATVRRINNSSNSMN